MQTTEQKAIDANTIENLQELFGEISLDDLLEFEIPDIELSKQNKIVNILKKIDDKIELNNQTNDNLLYNVA